MLMVWIYQALNQGNKMNTLELKDAIKNGEIKLHHTSLFRGYVSRTSIESEPSEYHGRFGDGFTMVSPNWDSTNYSYITYYIYA